LFLDSAEGRENSIDADRLNRVEIPAALPKIFLLKSALVCRDKIRLFNLEFAYSSTRNDDLTIYNLREQINLLMHLREFFLRQSAIVFCFVTALYY
jgi:hypothetical protein